MVQRAYYAGGSRVVVDGIPIRLARPISAANLKDLREFEKWRSTSLFDSRDEKARARVAEAKRSITAYAAALGISERVAKNRIERQRLHMLANPLRDISLEYDL